MFYPDCQGFCLLIATHSDTHSHIDGVKHRPVYWEKLEVQGLISHRPSNPKINGRPALPPETHSFQGFVSARLNKV